MVGNSIVCESNKTIKFDQEKPSCKITTETHVDNKWTKKNAVVESTCNDGKGSGCKRGLKLKETINYDFNGTFKYEDHWAIDNVGNKKKCAEKSYKVKVQKTPPSCEVIKDNHNQWSEDGVPVSIICYSADSPNPSAPIEHCGIKKGSKWKGTDTTTVYPTATYTVIDKADNKAYCSTTIYHKYQYLIPFLYI